MRVHREKLQIKSQKDFDVVDITTDVEKAVVNSGIEEGYALVYSLHTTCSILVNERETGLLADIEATLHRLVPQTHDYLHDDFNIRTENMHDDETKNAHAHIRQILGGRTSEYIPVGEGALLLGRWQRVMFIDFDCPKDREILIQVCGV